MLVCNSGGLEFNMRKGMTYTLTIIDIVVEICQISQLFHEENSRKLSNQNKNLLCGRAESFHEAHSKLRQISALHQQIKDL